MKKLVLALVAAVFLFPVVAFATSYWSGPKWVANTENWHLLSYFGEAYTVVCGKINLHTIAAQKYITPQAA